MTARGGRSTRTRMSAAEYRALVSKGGRSKYGNRKTEHVSPVVGRRLYDSAFEARHAAYLDTLVAAGELATWLPQVSLPLPDTGRRIVIDFMVVDLDGRVRFQDTKGAPPTREWLLKARILEERHGIGIEIVRGK